MVNKFNCRRLGTLLEDKLCLIFKWAPSVCSMTFPTFASFLVRFVFLQAEDGIRDLTVTGVQTCALPIFAVLGLDVNASAVECTVEEGGVRLGLGYIKDLARAEMGALVAERERNGPFRTLGELAARAGIGRRALAQLAWSGACEGLGGDAGRRSTLWRMGVAAPGLGTGDETQLALPLALPPAPRLSELGRWQRLIADYSTSGVTAGDHALAILRPRLQAPTLATSAQLARLPSGGSVAVAGPGRPPPRPPPAGGGRFPLLPGERGRITPRVPPTAPDRPRPPPRAPPPPL